MVPLARKPGWIALGSALVFHLLLLSLETSHRGQAGPVRGWLLDALVPGEKVVDRGFQGVRGLWDGYFALIGVHDENEKLHAENDQLRMQIQQQDEAVREAERLRGLLGLRGTGIGKLVAARVIGRPSRSLQTVTIDKGESDGVRQNASVITPDGVVGRVIATGRASAVVQLITDAQSEVAVLFRESRVQALFKGTGGKDLELDYIDDDSGIKEGDEVVTSGLDQVHPKGLPLATVTVVGQKGELFKAISARPHVDMGRLEEVLIVTDPVKPSAELIKNTPAPRP
jgi:rod shape-determining protein MreC